MTYERLTGAVQELAADVRTLGAEVDRLAPRQDRLDQTNKMLRKAMTALFIIGFGVAVLAIGNLFGSVHTCHEINQTRTGFRSVISYFEEQTLKSPNATPERRQLAEATFGHALSLVPPIDCGPKAIGTQIARGTGIAMLISLIGFLALMLLFPCGRRFAKRVKARNALRWWKRRRAR